MKNITIGGKKHKIGFTFNSFKYIEDVDMGALQFIESKPFKVVPFAGDLFYGAINHDPAKEFNRVESDKLLEEYVKESNLSDVLNLLLDLLNESAFFKSLQEK